jgi:hypothetical protein
MKIYHSRKSIQKMGKEQVLRLHSSYIRVISFFLIVGGLLSIMGIWGYLSPSFEYAAPIVVLVLWPWIMQSAFLSRVKKKQASSE